jgi:hypothetical protein
MNADAQIKEILERYGEDFASNTWVVPGGKARAIYHKTIERMAAKAGIQFSEPQIVCKESDNVVILVRGWIGDPEQARWEWSFGEASPKNNKNAYPWSMAEKRAKDRVALKLIGLHGLLYSEEEAEDFKAPAAPAPVSPLATYDEVEDAFTNSTTMYGLKGYAARYAPDIAEWPEKDRENIRKVYTFKAEALKKFGEAA